MDSGQSGVGTPVTLDSPSPRSAQRSILRPAGRQLFLLLVLVVIGAALLVVLLVRPFGLGGQAPPPTQDVQAPEPASDATLLQGELTPLPPPYTVEAGDNLLDLAEEFGTSVAALEAINDLD